MVFHVERPKRLDEVRAEWAQKDTHSEAAKGSGRKVSRQQFAPLSPSAWSSPSPSCSAAWSPMPSPMQEEAEEDQEFADLKKALRLEGGQRLATAAELAAACGAALDALDKGCQREPQIDPSAVAEGARLHAHVEPETGLPPGAPRLDPELGGSRRLLLGWLLSAERGEEARAPSRVAWRRAGSPTRPAAFSYLRHQAASVAFQSRRRRRRMRRMIRTRVAACSLSPAI
ncbi:unnamed protein product [Prorocentrum cordatum]|uniref:Uncharacterized protein n=1 Tax=Prorocentrum cordatum TaxID=2364126 RepID=A0ABN9Q8F4_9DINO|nr:unnamed protein product [Polarella glacialis]